MDDLTATRIEPTARNIDLNRDPVREGPPRKREKPAKSAPPPSIESDPSGEEIHQIDELA